MASSKVKLSPKHGLNPSIQQCFTCLQDMGVIMFGRLKGDAKAPHRVCLGRDSEPCDECKGHMEKGVILISMDERKTTDQNNPHRTGGWAVVTDSVIRQSVTPRSLANDIIARRMAFVTDQAWAAQGLPPVGSA